MSLFLKKNPSRQPHYRALRWLLECGHEELEPTSLFRLQKARLSCLISSVTCRGIWCIQCKALCQPVKFLGTCKLD